MWGRVAHLADRWLQMSGTPFAADFPCLLWIGLHPFQEHSIAGVVPGGPSASIGREIEHDPSGRDIGQVLNRSPISPAIPSRAARSSATPTPSVRRRRPNGDAARHVASIHERTPEGESRWPLDKRCRRRCTSRCILDKLSTCRVAQLDSLGPTEEITRDVSG
jgi:hypothetical protein